MRLLRRYGTTGANPLPTLSVQQGTSLLERVFLTQKGGGLPISVAAWHVSAQRGRPNHLLKKSMRTCVAVFARAPHEGRLSFFCILYFLCVCSILCCEVIDAAARCRYHASGYHMNKGSEPMIVFVLLYACTYAYGCVRARYCSAARCKLHIAVQ